MDKIINLHKEIWRKIYLNPINRIEHNTIIASKFHKDLQKHATLESAKFNIKILWNKENETNKTTK